jgi:hypothetical protein
MHSTWGSLRDNLYFGSFNSKEKVMLIIERLAAEEEERRKRLLVRVVGVCFPSVCGGDIVLTPREVPVGEWRCGPMPTTIEYTCACAKCGVWYNPHYFLDKEEKPTPP